MSNSFGGDFKRFFGRGLAILLPSIVTLWILLQASLFVYNNVAQPINTGIRIMILWGTPRVLAEEALPSWYRVDEGRLERRVIASRQRGEIEEPQTESQAQSQREDVLQSIQLEQFRDVWNRNWILDLSGFVVAIVLIYLAGLLLSNYFGRRIYTKLESLIAKIPGFKQVYPHVKQVVDLIFGDSPMKAFSEVVLVQYPRKGSFTVGLVTGSSFAAVREAAGGDVASVFIPTSPTPMTGFVINVRRDELVTLDMTVEQALRFVITAGVLTPETQQDTPPSQVLAKPAVKADAEGTLRAGGRGPAAEPQES